MSEKKSFRLSKLVREFNVKIDRILDFLSEKGITGLNPNSKVSHETYMQLLHEFFVDDLSKNNMTLAEISVNCKIITEMLNELRLDAHPEKSGLMVYGECKDEFMSEIENDHPNGWGKLTCPTGDKYEGEYKKGYAHGQGTFTYADGRKGVGAFKENKPWNITEYNHEGKIVGRYIDGVRTVFINTIRVLYT